MRVKSLAPAVPVAFMFGLAGPVHAGSEGPVIEEITVTAKKREESIYDVPVAISSFSADMIDRQGISNLIDIGKFVPNLNVTAFSAGHTSSANPFIRGIGLQDHLITTDPGVSVYVDGVYLGRQVGQNWNLTNIERVEVLRGPQGTLYGRNSIGGAINIITPEPGSDTGLGMDFKLGSRGRMNASIYGDLAVTDRLAFSATGSFKSRDGLGSFRNIRNAGVRVGELEDLAGRFDLLWRPHDRFSLRFTADGNDGDNGLRPYQTLIDELPNGSLYGAGYRNSDVATSPYHNNTGQRNQVRVTNMARGFSLTADYALNDRLHTRLIISDRESEYESGLDDDGFLDDYLSFPEVGKADQTSIELQFNGEFERWDFVSGLYWFEEEGSNNQDPVIFQGDPGSFLLAQEVQSFAVYGNFGYQITDGMRLSGGLRHTKDDKDAWVNINGFLRESASQDWNETSWEVAFSWDLGFGMTTYGTVQSGYQSGQFPARPYCLFGDYDFDDMVLNRPNCFVANDNVTAINYEVGIKGQPIPSLSISTDVFMTRYSDLPYQISTTEGSGFDTRNVIVDQDSTGIEFEGSWAVTRDFLIHGTLGLIDAEVDDPDAAAPLTPKITASLSPEYRLPTGNGGRVVFRADWSFRDDMYSEPSSDPRRLTKIDSRSILNLDIRYEPPSGNWMLAFYGYNVTDERYVNAKLNLTDYILQIWSNDASEFGVIYRLTL